LTLILDRWHGQEIYPLALAHVAAASQQNVAAGNRSTGGERLLLGGSTSKAVIMDIQNAISLQLADAQIKSPRNTSFPAIY
jgi:hypothetical protein